MRGPAGERRAPVSVAALMGSLITDELAGRMGANQRAAVIWSQANGDRERRHTTGVFLKRGACEGLPPILGVYVDSHPMLSDFNANKELYLVRLKGAGLDLSGVEFHLSRTGKRASRQRPARGPENSQQPLEELTQSEDLRIVELCQDLPKALRESAARAMRLSLMREKANNV